MESLHQCACLLLTETEHLYYLYLFTFNFRLKIKGKKKHGSSISSAYDIPVLSRCLCSYLCLSPFVIMFCYFLELLCTFLSPNFFFFFICVLLFVIPVLARSVSLKTFNASIHRYLYEI